MTLDCVKTVCPYCGVGCGLEAVPTTQKDGTSGWKIRGDRAHPSSQGMVCVKGATVMDAIHTNRLLQPLYRATLDQPLQPISWDAALNLIAERIHTTQQNYDRDAIAMYGSGQFQTEDYYVAQKLIKGCLGTNNFDANSRLCMSSAVSGYIQSFGSDGPPCCYDDLEQTDCAFLIGTNTAECHPIIFNRLRKHHKANPHVKLIVVDPRRTPTAEAADLHLAIRPGTDIDLLNGIGCLLLQQEAVDISFVQQHTNGFENYIEVLRHYTPTAVAQRCGIDEADLRLAAQYWAASHAVLSLWSMGMNQSSEGTAKVRSLIDLHLLTGMIGKPGAGPFSLTGQPNAMGGREAGGLAHLLPGYRSVKNANHRRELEQFWNLPAGHLSAQVGRTICDTIEGLETGDIRFLWIAATNPVVSLPDLDRVKAALERSPFTVYQDAYYPTETSQFAHLLLPAAQWSEKTGCMTNSERVVTLSQAFQEPMGEARSDWSIFAEVGRRLGFGHQFAFETSADVFAEFVQLTRDRPCDMAHINHARLQAVGPQQWGKPEIQASSPSGATPASGSARLYTNHHFATADGRANFGAFHSRGLAEPPNPDYPFVFTNGRLYGHWHTQTRTGHIEKIRQMHPQPFLEIHPRDAATLGVEQGDIVEVRSRRGSAQFPAKITRGIAPGTVFAPMHWGFLWADHAEINVLTHPTSCPDSRQPELKACAVQLIPVAQLPSLECIESPKAMTASNS
ncbi:molybdopterin oxidoreductase family protein [Leptolyngbya sp. AN02str]|uniref:molybdopterin oxidoreductase family protein n=1 Tax=Leptolyngbya sp. AN02str TaxID=3423363 RepID=UPI003D31452D